MFSCTAKSVWINNLFQTQRCLLAKIGARSFSHAGPCLSYWPLESSFWSTGGYGVLIRSTYREHQETLTEASPYSR